MILGRTPEGLIKIKKDDPLGLRAVECACCVECNGTEWGIYQGIVITKNQYQAWLKGGTISFGGTVSDTMMQPNDPPCPPYDVCNWSYSTSIQVPPQTCTLNFVHADPTASCVSVYYSQTQYPNISLKAGAYRSDEPGEVYRAQLWLTIACPSLFAGCRDETDAPADLGCYASTMYGLGTTLNANFSGGDSSVSFLGATFPYIGALSDTDGPRTASLNFTFTPN